MCVAYFCYQQQHSFMVFNKEGAHNVVDDYSRYIVSTTFLFLLQWHLICHILFPNVIYLYIYIYIYILFFSCAWFIYLNGSHNYIFYMFKWINTICFQRNPKITGFFFKVRPLLHISKCRTICMHSNNIILNFVPFMVIHKLCNVFSPKQSLQTWNDGNITKNLVRHLFCYFIYSISTYMTF